MVDGIFGTVAIAIGMFAVTNIDDIIVLTALFLASRTTGRPKGWQIWAGQYIGFAVLVAVSVIAALGLRIVPDRWMGLLGLVPFALGVRGLIATLRARGSGEDASAVVVGGVLPVVGVTLAAGADNVSVYPPVFRTISTGATVVTIAVFAVGLALWCLAGAWLGSYQKAIALVERYGQWIVPVVFMLLGVAMIIEFSVIGHLM